ncbi:MAG: ECF-type sigma factor [Planctomycetota bacterium]|jgi:hypothetical protein
MYGEGSVTHWFEQVREADSLAARALWERYFPRLVRRARKKLQESPRRAADEEDVAASVMESLFRAAEEGRFPDLADRDDLWRLLIRVTTQKVIDLKRHEARKRRGGGRVKGESALTNCPCLAKENDHEAARNAASGGRGGRDRMRR